MKKKHKGRKYSSPRESLPYYLSPSETSNSRAVSPSLLSSTVKKQMVDFKRFAHVQQLNHPIFEFLFKRISSLQLILFDSYAERESNFSLANQKVIQEIILNSLILPEIINFKFYQMELYKKAKPEQKKRILEFNEDDKMYLMKSEEGFNRFQEIIDFISNNSIQCFNEIESYISEINDKDWYIQKEKLLKIIIEFFNKSYKPIKDLVLHSPDLNFEKIKEYLSFLTELKTRRINPPELIHPMNLLTAQAVFTFEIKCACELTELNVSYPLFISGFRTFHWNSLNSEDKELCETNFNKWISEANILPDIQFTHTEVALAAFLSTYSLFGLKLSQAIRQIYSYFQDENLTRITLCKYTLKQYSIRSPCEDCELFQLLSWEDLLDTLKCSINCNLKDYPDVELIYKFELTAIEKEMTFSETSGLKNRRENIDTQIHLTIDEKNRRRMFSPKIFYKLFRLSNAMDDTDWYPEGLFLGTVFLSIPNPGPDNYAKLQMIEKIETKMIQILKDNDIPMAKPSTIEEHFIRIQLIKEKKG